MEVGPIRITAGVTVVSQCSAGTESWVKIPARPCSGGVERGTRIHSDKPESNILGPF